MQMQTSSLSSKSSSTGERKSKSKKTAAVRQTVDRSKNPESGKNAEERRIKGSVECRNGEAESENMVRRTELRNELLNFAEDDALSIYSFPPSLNSYERLQVHEIAEELGLLHISKGEGNERYIEVRKAQDETGIDLPVAVTAPHTGILVQSSLAEPVHTGTDGMTPCHLCGRKVPKENLTLHSLQCQAVNQTAAGSSVSSKRDPKPKKTEGQRKSNKPSHEEEEDFDSLIAAATKQNSTCNMAKCKNGVSTLGQTCAFCRQTFCLSHHVPEVHGCGDRAKQHARTVISREGVLYQGSGVPSKKPDPARRAQLQKKLDHRLDELSAKRKSKPKEK